MIFQVFKFLLCALRMPTYLGDDSLSCAVVFVEEVVSLNKELTGIFLFTCCPLPPQNDRTIGIILFQNNIQTL